MLTSQQRYQAIHGLLTGVAIGDALATPRVGRNPRAAMRRLGRRPLRFRLWPGRALYTDDTQFTLMAAQAILQSRSQSTDYHAAFRRRLCWYVLSLPIGLSFSTFTAGLKCWISRFGIKPASKNTGNSPATRSLLLGVVLHNTGHRYQHWARDTAALTHSHPLVADCCAVLATAAQIAAVTAGGRMNKPAVLETLIGAAKDPETHKALVALKPFIERRSTPRKVAEHFHWDKGISKHILPTTIMAIYCFIHFHTSFDRAVRSALQLGGNGDALVSCVGGLVGAHLGYDRLPSSLKDRIAEWPHGAHWIERLSVRLTDWPHGADDLLMAPGLPSYPLSQLLRNLSRWPLVLLHKCLSVVQN